MRTTTLRLGIAVLSLLASFSEAFLRVKTVEKRISAFEPSICQRNLYMCTRKAVSQLTMAREREKYDIIVIGGGPVGLSAAQSATAQGRTSLIIDNTPRSLVQFTGPTGIFSKALRDTAKKIDVVTLRGMGLRDAVVWRQIQDMTFDVLRTNGLNNLRDMQHKHIPHLRGNASFIDSNKLAIHQSGSQSVEVKGKTVLIATGSTAYRLPSIPYDDRRVFDSDTIKGLSFLPKSVTIIGAGIIAVEYARIFTKLQCRVTMIVRQRSLDVAFKRIGIDQGIAVQLQKDLNLNKVRIIFNAQVSAVEKPEVQNVEDSGRNPHRDLLTLTLTTADGQPHPQNQITTEVIILIVLRTEKKEHVIYFNLFQRIPLNRTLGKCVQHCGFGKVSRLHRLRVRVQPKNTKQSARRFRCSVRSRADGGDTRWRPLLRPLPVLGRD